MWSFDAGRGWNNSEHGITFIFPPQQLELTTVIISWSTFYSALLTMMHYRYMGWGSLGYFFRKNKINCYMLGVPQRLFCSHAILYFSTPQSIFHAMVYLLLARNTSQHFDKWLFLKENQNVTAESSSFSDSRHLQNRISSLKCVIPFLLRCINVLK